MIAFIAENIVFAVFFILLPITLNVAGWRRYKHAAQEDCSVRWQRIAWAIGLTSASVALAVLWGTFSYNYILFEHVGLHRPIETGEAINGTLSLEIVFSLAVLSIVAGIAAPRSARIPLLLTGAILGCLVVIMPKAVL